MTDTNTALIDDRRAAEPEGGEAMDRPKGKTLKPLGMLMPYVARHGMTVTAALVFLILSAAMSLAIPLLLGRAADSGAAADGSVELLISLIDEAFFLVFLAAVLAGVLGALRFFFISRFGERVAADLRKDLYAQLLKLGPAYHSAMRSGEAVSRLTADITLLEQFLGTTASLATRTFLTTVGALIMMMVVNWKLGGALLLMIPVAVLPVMFVGRIIRKTSNKAQTHLADAGAEAAEALDAIELVQAYGQEADRNTRFSRAVEATFSASMVRILARSLMIVMVTLLLFGGLVGVLWLGARAVATGTMSFGDLASMVLYALYAGSGLGMLAEVYGQVMRAAGAADRAAEVMNEQPAIEAPLNPVAMPQSVTGALEFDDVTFSYNDADASALRGFNLNVAPGEFVALVGPSGAGKTTVFRLALRLFDVQAGHIRLDNVASTAVRPSDWRAQFAYAPQESALFTGSAAENIAFGKPDADNAILRQAAIMAEAMSFLDEKQGLETPLGQKGRSLSGGQRQRVALARALVRDAPVLLLDEATSALDSESEAAVQRAIENAAKGRTTLVIAHRLSTVRKASRIIVMDQGRVVEEGTHDALVVRGGLYSRLADLQFSREDA